MANEQNLKKFTSEYQPKNNGRPKKIETVLKDYFLDEHNIRLTKSQMHDIIQVLLGKSKKDLVDLAKDESLPFWVSLIAKKAQRDYEKGSIHILDVLFDRVYGKPKEEVKNILESQPFDLKKTILNFMNEGDEETKDSDKETD
jgi:hypothetical protein